MVNIKKSWVIGILTCFFILFSIQAYAANCGGAIPCNCSDTLNATRTLTAADNLSNCPGHALIVITAGITLDCDGNLINGSGANYGITLNVDDVTVTDCIVTNFNSGIRLNDSHRHSISGSTIDDNSYGIFLDSSDNSTISGNTFDNNSLSGIYAFISDNHDILTNTFTNNREGINLRGSQLNTVTGNTVQSSTLRGVYVNSGADNNTITSNTFTGNNNSGLHLYNAAGNTIGSNTVNNNLGDGIYLDPAILDGTQNNTVEDNTIEGNTRHGLFVESSDSNVIRDNTIENNGVDGLHMDAASGGNLFNDNTVCSNNGTDINNPGSNVGVDNTCNTTNGKIDTPSSNCTYLCGQTPTTTTTTTRCGGGGGPPPITYHLFDYGFSTYRGGIFYFKFNNADYKINIERYNNDYTMLSINLGRKGYELMIGEPLELDLDNDGGADVKLTYEGISTAARREIIMKIEPYGNSEIQIQTVKLDVVEEPMIEPIVEELHENIQEEVIESNPVVSKNKVKIERNPTNHLAIGIAIIAITILGLLITAYIIRK